MDIGIDEWMKEHGIPDGNMNPVFGYDDETIRKNNFTAAPGTCIFQNGKVYSTDKAELVSKEFEEIPSSMASASALYRTEDGESFEYRVCWDDNGYIEDVVISVFESVEE